MGNGQHHLTFSKEICYKTLHPCPILALNMQLVLLNYLGIMLGNHLRVAIRNSLTKMTVHVTFPSIRPNG